MKNTWKKLLAMTLVASMLTGMLGVGAWAEEDTAGGGSGETPATYCGKEAHTHSGTTGCYEGEGWTEKGDESYVLDEDTGLYYLSLTCVKEVHTHTDECYEVAQVETTYVNESNVVVGNFIYDFHEDGTASVVSGSVVNGGELNIPATVTYEDLEYRVTAIEDDAFNGQNKYAKITLPEGLETIGASAFRGIYPFGGNLVIPDSVTSIGDYAFYGFHKYAKDAYHIDRIVLGENLKTIGNQAFYFAMPTDGFYQVELECGPNLESVHKWAFPYGYDKNTYTYHSCISTITVNGILEGSPEAIALDEILNVSYGLQPQYGVQRAYPLGVDPSHIATASGLQKAINASEGPTTLTLTDYITISGSSIVIPAGKDITIQDDGNRRTIETAYGLNAPAFVVEADGKLTFTGTNDAEGKPNLGFYFNGNGKTSPGKANCVQVKGEFVLDNARLSGAWISGGGMTRGVVIVDNGGKFTMTGGEISDMYANGSGLTAAVVVTDGGTFDMSGGAIQNNYVSGSPTFASGGVLLFTWNPKETPAKMTLSGDARITGNQHDVGYGAVGGGGITLVGDSELIMNGGSVTGNQSYGNRGCNGGGICVAGSTQPMQVSDYEAKCVFTMNGGEISENFASYGGGIYVNSNYVTLNAGAISGNEASQTGGGVYVETPDGNKTGAHLRNAVISGNTASYMGGGMYFCPTGNASLYVNEGCAIFDNQTTGATAAADDFVSVVNSNVWSDESKHALLSERALGGGLVQWYRDGSVSDPTMGGGWGGVDSDSVRYDAENPVLVEPGDYETNLALKTVMSDAAKALAIANARLLITDNTATRGGGVGSNGSATMGADPNDPVDPTPSKEYTLTVNKVWENVPEAEQTPVTIQLLATIDNKTYELDTIELSKENGWTGSFAGLPEVLIGKLSIKELVNGADSYEIKYSEITTSETDDTEKLVTVTNSKPNDPDRPDPPTTYTSLTVNKVWAGDDDTDVRPGSVTVQLYRNGTDSGRAITLNEGNGWSHTWNNLNDAYTWTVGEVDVPEGYTPSTDTNRSGTEVTITNTYTASTPTPTPTPTPEPTPSETPVIEELEETDTPLAELPTETEQPATEPPKEEFEDLEDEDVPLAQVPETGDSLGTWLMMSAGALLGLAWLGRKREEA